MLSTQRTKQIDVHFLHDFLEIHFCQWFKRFDDRNKTNIVKLFCKINNKRINISFSNAFYVFKCFFNLINFDQLNDLCSMTYKFKIFIVENQNIITRKRVNNVFFLNCENMWITTSSSHLSSIISRCRQMNQKSRLIKTFWTCDMLD